LANNKTKTYLKVIMDNAVPSPPWGTYRVTMIGDTQYAFSALEGVMAVSGPHFANRILELESTRTGWGELNQDAEMEETPFDIVLTEDNVVLVDLIYLAAGDLNLADIASQDIMSQGTLRARPHYELLRRLGSISSGRTACVGPRRKWV
jgi:hypothetical protein